MHLFLIALGQILLFIIANSKVYGIHPTVFQILPYKLKPNSPLKFDFPLLLIALLLILTLTAFFSGAFSYPVGWIILLLLLYFRVRELRDRKKSS